MHGDLLSVFNVTFKTWRWVVF